MQPRSGLLSLNFLSNFRQSGQVLAERLRVDPVRQAGGDTLDRQFPLSAAALVMDQRVLSIQSHVTYGYVGGKAAVFPLQCLGYDVDVSSGVLHTNNQTNKTSRTQGDKHSQLFQSLRYGPTLETAPPFDRLLYRLRSVWRNTNVCFRAAANPRDNGGKPISRSVQTSYGRAHNFSIDACNLTAGTLQVTYPAQRPCPSCKGSRRNCGSATQSLYTYWIVSPPKGCLELWLNRKGNPSRHG